MNRLSFLLLLFASLLFLNCTPNDDDIYAIDWGMTANINGNHWSAEVYAGSFFDGFIHITGRKETGETLNITISGELEGVYEFENNAANSLAFIPIPGVSPFVSSGDSQFGGSVEILEINYQEGYMMGSFGGDIHQPGNEETMEITNGVFKVPF